MWKIFGGFIIFAAFAVFLVLIGGDKLGMQGEAGGHDSSESAPVQASSPCDYEISRKCKAEE
jgi:hypothetical protein